jgi:hypothetical protein
LSVDTKPRSRIEYLAQVSDGGVHASLHMHYCLRAVPMAGLNPKRVNASRNHPLQPIVSILIIVLKKLNAV